MLLCGAGTHACRVDACSGGGRTAEMSLDTAGMSACATSIFSRGLLDVVDHDRELEPGGMRTNWGVRANQDMPDLLPEYEASVGAVAKALKSYWGHEISDPIKVAQVVLHLAASDRLPAHLLIGSDAVRFAGEAEATRAADAAYWREISLSTDFDAPTALPAVRF